MKTSVMQRRYHILSDFMKVYDFLEETYSFETLNSYLLPQYFEYAQHLQWFDYISSHRIGIWEDGGVIIGICTYEMEVGSAHLHAKKGYEFLLPEMLEWTESEISVMEKGQHQLQVWVTDKELNKKALLEAQDYELVSHEAVTIFDYQHPFLERQLPNGFTLIDGTHVDYKKMAICFAKGFGNSEEIEPITDADINGNFKRFNSPHANNSLTTVVVAPDGEYACALGMWYDESNKYAYLEPMATIPKYRRMGLGTIALMEAMKKTKALGATYCFGGPVMDYYPMVGFKITHQRELWKKSW